jgi:hypothetical protein
MAAEEAAVAMVEAEAGAVNDLLPLACSWSWEFRPEQAFFLFQCGA